MKFPQLRLNGSLRWQLQLWHGLLLALVLAGFGWTSWRLQRASLFARNDQELERNAQLVIRELHPQGPNQPPPPGQMPPPSGAGIAPSPGFPPDQENVGLSVPLPPPPQQKEDEQEENLDPLLAMDRNEQELEKNSLYEVVWDPRGQILFHSDSAPKTVLYPSSGAAHSGIRIHNNLREYFEFLPTGECILVGKEMDDDFASLNRSAWVLFSVGVGVLMIGLFIGWVITSKLLRPLTIIKDTAEKIAAGDLSQRIPIPSGENEIAGLVRVLNQTFSRLETSFERQSQFTADASHELRTPISVILTHAQNALARERSPEEYRESLAACHRAAKRMKHLTESLLALVRVDQGGKGGERINCQLDQIANDALEMLKPLAAELHITMESDMNSVSCIGNPGQLAQVCNNLLENAIRYNSTGGTVTLRTSKEPGFSTITVEDTGRGIDNDDIPHLFERFYRVDKSRSHGSGVGLGLAITAGIVKAHGGKIEVKSKLAQGSLFIVKLPA